MIDSQFNKIVEQQLTRCEHMLIKKGEEYAPKNDAAPDRLAHFKKAAVMQNETPKQALLGMLAKHLVSISDMCICGDYTLNIWDEKITDSMNYMLLLKALVIEEKEGTLK